jgi:hypothetical protein
VFSLIVPACVNYGTPANCYTKAAAIFLADLIISSLLVFTLFFICGYLGDLFHFEMVVFSC